MTYYIIKVLYLWLTFLFHRTTDILIKLLKNIYLKSYTTKLHILELCWIYKRGSSMIKMTLNQ